MVKAISRFQLFFLLSKMPCFFFLQFAKLAFAVEVGALPVRGGRVFFSFPPARFFSRLSFQLPFSFSFSE